MKHEKLRVPLVQVVLVAPHLDVHVVDRVPARFVFICQHPR